MHFPTYRTGPDAHFDGPDVNHWLEEINGQSADPNLALPPELLLAPHD